MVALQRTDKKAKLFVSIALSFLTVGLILLVLFGHSKCPYDLNDDKVIGLSDLTRISSEIGKECNDCEEDLNEDGKVTEEDVKILQQYIGASCREMKKAIKNCEK
jgi:NACalpha-BTF3-like transcription factor